MTARIVTGSAYGKPSPVVTFRDTLFVDLTLAASTVLPIDVSTEERAVYLRRGRDCRRPVHRWAPARVSPRRCHHRDRRRRRAFVLLGDGPRHIRWNFVSLRREHVEQAKADWKAAHFDTVPGDEKEFIPLPD